MTGFFLDIRNYFGAKYSGRYLTLLLRELGRHEATTFAEIFQLSSQLRSLLKSGALQVECEWQFAPGRRADLAVLSGGRAILVVEVKEDDVRGKRNPQQLEDYLKYISENRDARFVHISRFALPKYEKALLANVASRTRASSMSYFDLYGALSPCVGTGSVMLQEYLEDIGVNKYKALNLEQDGYGKSMTFLTSQLLGFPQQQGLGRLNSTKSVNDMPKIIDILMGNLAVLGAEIRQRYGSLFPAPFTRKLRIEPYFDLVRLKKHLASANDDAEALLCEEHGRFTRSGIVWFSATGAIANRTRSKFAGGEWHSLEFGYGVQLSLGRLAPKRQGAEIWLFAAFMGRTPPAEFRYDNWYTKSFKIFPDQTTAMSKLGRCIEGAKQEAMKHATGAYRNILVRFNTAMAKA